MKTNTDYMLVFNYCDLMLSRADSNTNQTEAGDNLIRDISAGKLCLRNAIYANATPLRMA